jgi:hypothetical protein
MKTKNDFRERFRKTDDRFEAALLAALRAHKEGVAVFFEAHAHLQQSIDELQESQGELKRLIVAQGVELRALRERQ